MEQNLEDRKKELKKLKESFGQSQNQLKMEYEELKNCLYEKDRQCQLMNEELRALKNSNPKGVEMNLSNSKLQSIIIQKENEIAFLKETVRVECEERMGLVASMAKMQIIKPNKEESKVSGVVTIPEKPVSLQKGLEAAISGKSESPKLSAKDKEFFKLFKNAAYKNSRRLAKSKPLL